MEINLLQVIHNSSRSVLLPGGTSVSAAGGRCTIPSPPGRTAFLAWSLGILFTGTVQRCCPGFFELSAARRIYQTCWWKSCLWQLVKGNRAALNSLCPKVKFIERLIQTDKCLKPSYFISTVSPDQKERLVKKKNHHVRQRPETSSVYQVSSMLSDLELTVLQLLLLRGLGFSCCQCNTNSSGSSEWGN